MNSTLYNSSTDREQSVTNLVQIHSLTQLLEQDHEQLLKQSHSISYYHPNLSRDKAEQLLRATSIHYKTNGLFLLRDCTISPHDLSLSLIYNDQCYHYKIQLIYDIYFSIDSGPQIAGIESLIRYYQERADGLITVLSTGFIQGQPPPIAVRCKGSTNTLHRACKQGNLDIVKKILSAEYLINQPDVNGKDAYGSTALHEASYFGHDDIVRLLIRAGAHVAARDTDGATALHRAAAGNRPSTLLILIKEGLADYEERNYTNYWVPLHEAAFYNSAACVQVLLDCGTPLRPRTDQGKIPLQLAEEVKSDESIIILLQHKTSSAKSHRLDWLHDKTKFDRIAAKQLIESAKNGPCNGMFVVRYSSKNSKNYALTLFNENGYFNFEIVYLNDVTFYIDDGPYFDSLEHLIDHYCRIPDGLPTTLTCSVNQFGEVVQCRMHPFTTYTNNKNKDTSKHNLSRQTSINETKNINKNPQPSSPTHRATFPSSLNSSVTSLNSLSSRSRASSTQESPLSTSSSSVSLSNTSPLKQTIDEISTSHRKPFIDRRKSIGGKIQPYTPACNNEPKSNGTAIPIATIEKRKSSKLNLISPNQIQQTAKLGEGEFGQVFEGFYQENSTAIPVAIKLLKDYSYSAKQDFLREAEHMSKLNHHCICKLYGIVDSNNNDMMMIMELLLLGSMLDYLSKHKNKIDEYHLKLWASQIADGMEYMECKGIVHRDLAARNILLQSTDQVKIADFGLSRCTDADIYVQKSDSKVPIKWYAPEAISIGKFTSKSDVWSFGVTLWEMFAYGAIPYGDMSGSDVYYLLKYGKRLEKPTSCPSYLYQIILQCWEWDEKKRPAFYQLVYSLRNIADHRQSNKTIQKSVSTDEQKNEQYRINGNDHGSKTVIQF